MPGLELLGQFPGVGAEHFRPGLTPCPSCLPHRLSQASYLL